MSDFTAVFGEWLGSTVSLEVYEGAGFDGETYSVAVDVLDVLVDDTRRLVRNSNGNEVVSESTLYVPDSAVAFQLADKVTVNGRTTAVIKVARPQVVGLFSFTVVNLE